MEKSIEAAGSPTKASKWPQILAALAATLGSFGCGTGIAWSSPVLPKIDPSLCKNDCDLSDVSASLVSWVGPLFPLGAVFSGPVAFFLLNKLGRKKTLMCLSVPMLIGYILLTSTKALDSIIALLIGRFLTGFSGGAYALVAPYYVSEISEPSIRGGLSSMMQLMSTLGVCFVDGLNVNEAMGWVAISAVCIAIPVIMLGSLMFMPDSPVYLVAQNRRDDAKKALQWFRGPQVDVEVELNQLEQSKVKEDQVGSIGIKDLFTKRVYFQPFIITMFAMFGQQFCGVNAVFFYLQTIFEKAGSSIEPSLAAFIVALAQVVGTLAAVLIVDKFGRKILLILSNAFMAVSIGALGFYFFMDENKYIDCGNSTVYITPTYLDGPQWKDMLQVFLHTYKENCQNGSFDAETVKDLGWLPVVSLIVFILAFSIGFGPLVWTLNAEIHAPEAKRLCASIAFSFNWSCAFLVTKFYPDMEEGLHTSGTYFLFGAICFVGIFILIFFVPETKGKSPDEMKAYFLRKSSKDSMAV